MFTKLLRLVPRATSIIRQPPRSRMRIKYCGRVQQRLLSTSPTTMTLVTTKIDDHGVALVTFNNPDKLNAMTEEMGNDFQKAIENLKKQPRGAVRAVVITGAGRAFSAGGDIKFLKERAESDALSNAETMRAFYRRFLSVRSLEVPTIAAINGHAIGAGLYCVLITPYTMCLLSIVYHLSTRLQARCVACACDIRVCATSAKMGWTFVGLGLHPGMAATHFTPQIIGHQQAARWLLTGETFTGAEAQAMGLVVEATDTERVVSRALELAATIARQGGDADSQGHNYASPDMLEGLAAIRDKRKPQFTAKM